YSYFTRNLLSRWTEYDYLLKIWGSIIEAILSINGMVRLKSGESINPMSTTKKGELYDVDKTRAFKIDLRFIFDTEKVEYDVGAGESSREPVASKIFHDLGKLLREGKEVLDGILGCVLDDVTAERASGWIIQICGLQGQISSLHLIRNGLYVAIPQYKLRFPTSISGLESLMDRHL
ncbi:hypothetical protein INT45_012347, partial [Circinella minor]